MNLEKLKENPIELAKVYGIMYLIKKYLETKDKKCLEEIKRIAEYGRSDK